MASSTRSGAIHHLDITVSDVARSTAFYDRVMSPLGFRRAPDCALPALRATALVHEPPARVRGLLTRAGVPEWAPLATAVLGAFGAIWRAETAEALASYARRHRGHLAEALLFELAHEGAATPAVVAAARVGGLGARFRGWVQRLHARLPTPGALE